MIQKTLSFLLYICFVFIINAQVNPNQIGTLAHWYSADSISMDSNLLVDIIYNKSSNNDNHLIQNNTNHSPSFIAESLNSRPSLAFDGNNKFLETDFDETLMQPYTLFVVWNVATPGTKTFLDDRDNRLIEINGSNVRFNAGSALQYSKTLPFDFIITQVTVKGSSSKLYENGNLMNQGSVGSRTLPGITLGKRIQQNDRFFDGSFSQLLIYEGELTEAQTDSVYIYLSDYYTPKVNLGPNISQYGFCDTTIHAGERFSSYLWADGSTNESLTINTPGTYWVEATDRFGFISSDTIVVEFSPIQYPSTSLYCPEEGTVWDTELGNHFSYLWSNGSTNQSITIDNAGDYNVTITDTNGCSIQSDILSFSVDPYYESVNLGSDVELCAGAEIGLESGIEETVSYLWSTGETSARIPIFDTGTYWVEVSNSNGCIAYDTIEVEISGTAPVIDVELESDLCINSTFTFKDNSISPDGSPIVNRQWDFDDGTISNSIEGDHIYSSIGIYHITLTVENSMGCINSTVIPIEVHELPEIEVAYSDACQNRELILNGESTNSVLEEWNWTVFDGESYYNYNGGSSIAHTFENSGNQLVELQVVDVYGCINEDSALIEINSAPVISSFIPNDCVNTLLSFNDDSFVPDGEVANVIWVIDESDTINSTEFTTTYSNEGVYSIKQIVESDQSCVSSKVITFEVFDCTPDFYPTEISGLTHWYLADSALISNFNSVDTIYNLAFPFDHLIQVDAENSPTLEEAAFKNKSTIKFNGTNQFLEVDFQDTIEQPYTIFTIWKSTTTGNRTFIDNKDNYIVESTTSGIRIRQNSTLNYSRSVPFDFLITQGEFNNNNSKLFESGVLMSEGSLGNSYLPGITVGKRHLQNDRFFKGEFSQILIFDGVLNPSEIDSIYTFFSHYYTRKLDLGPDIVQYGYCDATIYAGDRFKSYLWSDGSTDSKLTVSESGSYWVEVRDYFGLVSRDTIEVKMGVFDYPTTNLYCPEGTTLWKTNLEAPYSYLWSDGSTGEDLTIVNPGDYYVTITDTNGCFIHSDTITFMEDPFVTTATLGSLDSNMCTGNELYLSAGAEDVISYLWSTGASTPSIEITQGGNYSVEVTNDNGCVVEETIEITIIGDAPNTEINIPSYACLESEFDFSDASTTLDGSDIISWAWEFGDGHESTNPTGNHSYSVAGDYTVSLQIETSSGCFGTSTANFEVKELPALNINTQNYCQYEEISFIGGQNSPTLISDWQWDFGDPQSGENIAYGAMVSHSYESSGAKEVQLIAEDIYGCIDTLMHTLDISPTPIADFEFTEVCEGGVVNFTNTTNIDYPGVVGYYQWSFGEGTGSSLTHPQKPFSIYGDYTVSLTAGSNAGCNSSISYPLKVHAFPSVDYELTQNCAGISAEFKDVSFVPNGSVAEVKWGIDGAVPDVGFGIEKTFDQAGNYQLDHVVTSAFGCTQTQTTNFTIHDYLNADFVFDPLAFVVDYPIDFVSTSVGADVYAWTFGDFAYSSASDTSIVFEEDQIGDMVEVQLYIENEFGCMDSISLKREVLERHTDLDISQLYVQDIDGFSTLGVRIKNNGTTPIEEVDLFVQKPGFGLLKETWSGLLQAGESEIHVFALSPSAFIGVKDSLNNYLCIRGEIVSPSAFKESDLSNNIVCEVLAPSVGVMIRPFPNPVRDLLNLHIVLGEDTKATVKIYDNVGRLVHVVVEDGELEKGLNVFEVEVGDWGRGVYVVRFEGGEVEGVRFVK